MKLGLYEGYDFRQIMSMFCTYSMYNYTEYSL